MLDINIINFLTVGLMALLFIALANFGGKMAGIDISQWI